MFKSPKFWVVLGILAVLVITVWSSYNSLVRQEIAFQEVHTKSKNALSRIINDMRSQGLAVDKYGEMVSKVLKEALQGRYGQKGAQGAVIAIAEQNPTIDSAVMTKLQAVISSGYAHFEQSQNEFIAARQAYKGTLATFPSNIVANFFGFPRIKMDDFNIVLSEEAGKAFDTGKMKPVNPFEKQ